MSRNEPQITEIASYLAAALPTEGAEPEEAKQAWRHSLRYARKSGAIDRIAGMLRNDPRTDEQIRQYADELTR
jgi:hypothetical protein